MRSCWAIAVAFAIACGGKKNEGPPPEVTGLAAVPSSAEVIIAVDVEKLATSPIVARAVEQLLLRDPELAQRWAHVRDGCKIDLAKQVKRLTIALGPSPNPQKGPGPMLMVATGDIAETELSSCVRALVGKGGGTLTAKPLDGRTLYQVKEQNRAMFYSFGRADTVVLGTSDAYVAEALGKGKKALDHPELAAWLKMTDANAAIRAVGRAGERVKAGLVRVTQGQLKTGPTAFVASIDLTNGAKFDTGAVMASREDAKQLESQLKAQVATLIMVAQLKSLGTMIQKIKIAIEGSSVRLQAELSMDDVNHVLSMLDGGGAPAQDSPPATPDPGSATK